MLGLAALVLLRQPQPTLNSQFREINELKADFDRLSMDLNRISRGGGRTMGASADEANGGEGTEVNVNVDQSEQPEQAQPEQQEENQEEKTGE